MAEAMASNTDILTCSICLELLKDPTTLQCGHSYCMVCIKACWDHQDRKGVYSCPQCRKTFRRRPALSKNIIMAELVEQSKKLSLRPGLPLVSEDPKTREDFLKYYTNFTLDPNTACTCIELSNRNTKARMSGSTCGQGYPDHPERFDWKNQVLCRESVTGRCYWEVNIRCGEIDVAVAYKEISRKGNDTRFGENSQSWSMEFYSNSTFHSFKHRKKEQRVSGVVSSTARRVGVYVDHRAGTLAFYQISDKKMTLLHRVKTTFTRPLYPGYYMYEGEVQLLHLPHK